MIASAERRYPKPRSLAACRRLSGTGSGTPRRATRNASSVARSIREIDPRRAFGKLVVAGAGIPTAVIADRLRAGDTLVHLAKDYHLKLEQVGAALRWELGAYAY